LDALRGRISARSALRQALALGKPGGYIWRLLDAGPELEPLLRDLREDGKTSQAFQSYLASLLDAFSVTHGESAQSQAGELPDPLTPRELEIMRLIGKGFTNPEIASQLVVSLNTIKKHTSNIYGKLEVRSRTQAIARAQQLNLL
jgi:LuxR family maltose regulon positive regulatory protein